MKETGTPHSVVLVKLTYLIDINIQNLYFWIFTYHCLCRQSHYVPNEICIIQYVTLISILTSVFYKCTFKDLLLHTDVFKNSYCRDFVYNVQLLMCVYFINKETDNACKTNFSAIDILANNF